MDNQNIFKQESWNPVIGCSKKSAGCKNCYAELMAYRLQEMGTKGYENGFKVTLRPERLDKPLKKKNSVFFFVNSMSDLFHKDVPFDFIDRVLAIIKATPYHRYMVLTKRAEIMADYFKDREVPNNLWLGVTVENQKEGVPRIDYLRSISAGIRFICAEPLLEDLGKLNLKGIDWVIVGGESGNKARVMEKEWVINIKEQCERDEVCFSFKQWGSWNEKKEKKHKRDNGRLLDGRIYDKMPEGIGEVVQKSFDF